MTNDGGEPTYDRRLLLSAYMGSPASGLSSRDEARHTIA